MREVKKEWKRVSEEIEEIYVRDKLRELTIQIGQIEKDDQGSLMALQQEFGTLSRRLTELSR